jgi:N,N'-diacetyllegionaminate synthase
MKTLIIAEAGVNHNGDMELAKRLIAEAVSADADLVRFQSFSAGKAVTKTASEAEYQKPTTGSGEAQIAMLRRFELTRPPDLKSALRKRNSIAGALAGSSEVRS